MVFENGSERGEIDRIGIGDKERGVRVAHIGAYRAGERPGRYIGAQRVHRLAQRDVAPLRARRAHIDRDAAVRQ